ncbi:MAG: hypothetical protein OEY51_12805, partial [Cyclobacteriaceae bacterium]|nr:hypothetical protein [Cyclobacteriaceae bacterium]
MKLFHKIYFLLPALLLNVTLAHAQDNRTLETKVADILTETPTRDLTHLNKLMEEMIGLGDEGIQLFISQLVPPGEGDDSRVRDAMESLSRYLSTSINKEGKRIFINSVKKTIISDVDDAVKVYLIRRLDVLIDTEDIEFLANQLDKPALMEAAAKALLSTNNPAIEAHLVKKLKSSEGDTKIRVIKALGELSSAKATTTLSEELKTATGPLRTTLLYTLGQSGHENAFDPLFEAANGVGFKYEETNATSSFLSLGERAVAVNNIALGKRVSDAIIEQCTIEEQLHFRARGIGILSKTLSTTSFNKILLKEFKSTSSSFRGALLNHAANLEGEEVTKSWAKTFLKASNEAKVEILGMLFTRSDASALPALDKVATYDDLAVMEALLQARAKLGKKEAIPGILESMKDERLATAGKNALLGITDNKDLSTLISVINILPPASKAAMIDVIAARRGSNYFTNLESMLSDNSEAVQQSAYKALEKVVTADHINLLNQLYANASTENASYITRALVAALKQIESEEKRIEKTLEILGNSPSAAHVLSLTPEIGGGSVREAVLKAFKNENTAEAAFDALCRWPDASVAGEVFTICENSTGDKRKKAFEGYLRLSTLGTVPADQQLLMLRKIMPLAQDIEEKNQVIRSLARVRTFPALVHVSQYLDDENLKAMASRAVMNICLPQPSDKTGLTGALVEEALIKSIDVMSGPESQYMKEDIRVYLRQMTKTSGFVSMFNGKDLAGWKGYVDNPINVAKMKPSELAKK